MCFRSIQVQSVASVTYIVSEKARENSDSDAAFSRENKRMRDLQLDFALRSAAFASEEAHTRPQFGRLLACAESYGFLGIAIVAPPPKFTIESRHS